MSAHAFLEAAVKSSAQCFGNTVAGDTAITERTAFFNKLGIKAYGMRHLNHYGGQRAFGVVAKRIGVGTKIIVGGV